MRLPEYDVVQLQGYDVKIMELNKIYNQSCLTGIDNLEDKSVDCCVTSPPYFGQRDYGTAKWIGGDPECSHRRENKNNNPDWAIQTRGKVDKGVGDAIYKTKCLKCGAVREDKQIGLEETPELYVANLVEVFRQVNRVLKPQGTLWLNLGDTYAGYYGDKYSKPQSFSDSEENTGNTPPSKKSFDFKTCGFKPKDLIGIPWMTAFALRNDGWYLRQDIIWNKPNPMPESVTDRCTKAHEYIFLLSKQSKYYYDAESIKTDAKDPEDDRRRLSDQSWDNKGTPDEMRNGIRPRKSGNLERKDASERGPEGGDNVCASVPWEGTKANKRSVWTINTKPFKEAHFATFPEQLASDCIKAGCPEGGTVLDPFMGAGTTALVAKKLNRNFIGFELNPDYIRIAEKRLFTDIGLFL